MFPFDDVIMSTQKQSCGNGSHEISSHQEPILTHIQLNFCPLHCKTKHFHDANFVAIWFNFNPIMEK